MNPFSTAINKAAPVTLSPATRMLLAIGATGKHLYEGTVSPAIVAKRRAANKAARAARRRARRA